MVRALFGKLCHLWQDNKLHLNLHMRLYKSCVCNIMVYGAEVWTLNEKMKKALNGVNAQMVSVITANTPHQEVSSETITFNLVK